MLILVSAIIICVWWSYTFFYIIMKSDMKVGYKVMTSVFVSIFGFFASGVILYAVEATSQLI